MSKKINLTCPHCAAALVIDTKAGVVLHHEAPPEKKDKIDFEERLEQMKADQQNAADRMDEAMRKEKDRDRLMADRFAELMKGAKDKDDGVRPVRDIDFD